MYYGSVITTIPYDLTNVNDITGFSTKTVADEMAVLFKVGTTWQRINKEGVLEDVPTQRLTTISILKEGNTIAELSAMVSVPALQGKRFNVAVAAASSELPTPVIDFNVNYTVNDLQLKKTIESEEFIVRGEIESIKPKFVGKAEIEVNGYKSGRWLGWTSLTNAAKDYEKVKFRAILSVDKVGDRTYLDSVSVVAKTKDAIVPSQTVDIFLDGSYKDATIYVIGNNAGTIRAFCSPSAGTETWKELESITRNSFENANGKIKIQLTMDSNVTPEVNGIVIAEGR